MVVVKQWTTIEDYLKSSERKHLSTVDVKHQFCSSTFQIVNSSPYLRSTGAFKVLTVEKIQI